MTSAPIEAWVISLTERPDRLAAFRTRAAAAELDVQELVVPRSSWSRDGWGGSSEACGCAESHLRLLSAGAGDLLVFEDDAMLPPMLSASIELALAVMPPAWELCLLGTAHTIDDGDVIVSGLVPIRQFLCTHAYLVSGRGRSALADCAARANRHWDYLASRRMCGRGQVYGFVPSVVDQDPALGGDIPSLNAVRVRWPRR